MYLHRLRTLRWPCFLSLSLILSFGWVVSKLKIDKTHLLVYNKKVFEKRFFVKQKQHGFIVISEHFLVVQMLGCSSCSSSSQWSSYDRKYRLFYKSHRRCGDKTPENICYGKNTYIIYFISAKIFVLSITYVLYYKIYKKR